jgi:hypothetical protein
MSATSAEHRRDFQEPEEPARLKKPYPLLNPALHDDSLSFEMEDHGSDEVLKFELKLVGDRRAELPIVSAPLTVKPIPFKRT